MRQPHRRQCGQIQKSLGLEEIEVIETLAGEHMDHYGYEE